MDDDSRGPGSAFNRAVNPGDEPGQDARRMLAVSFAGVMAVALGAVLLGAFGHRASNGNAGKAGAADAVISPTTGATTGHAPAPTTHAPAPTTSTPPTVWSVVSGPDCGASGGLFAAATGSVSNTDGGYTGGGCHGQYLSVPVSGNATEYDMSRMTLWTFTFAPRFTACQLDTYVPNSSDIAKVGGDPAYYYVYGSQYTPASKASPQMTYEVPQMSTRGQWVSGQRFAVTSGTVTVVMLDAGLDGTPATQGRHIAAADIRLTCHLG